MQSQAAGGTEVGKPQALFPAPENPQSEGTDWPRKGGLLPGNWGIKAGFLDEEDLQLASDP